MNSTEPATRASQSGFTLLEVMAAVGIMALVFTVLASHAMQGLASHGQSRRTLAAADIADEIMADLEIGMNEQVLPPEGVEESERDEYRVVVAVQPFSEIEVPPGTPPPRGPDGRLQQYDELDLLIVHESRGFATALRTIEVSVSWEESGEERSIVRTTYGLDMTALQALVAASGVGAGDSGETEDDGEGDGGPDDDLDLAEVDEDNEEGFDR